MSTCTFYISMYFDHIPLHYFCFRVSDIRKTGPVLHVANGKIWRRGYVCDELTSGCMALKRMSFPYNWMYLEVKFGFPSSALSEIFKQQRGSSRSTWSVILLMNTIIEVFRQAYWILSIYYEVTFEHINTQVENFPMSSCPLQTVLILPYTSIHVFRQFY